MLIRFLEGNVNTLVEHYRKQHILPQRICCCQEPVVTFLKWLLDINEGLECAFTKKKKKRFFLRCSHALGDAESLNFQLAIMFYSFSNISISQNQMDETCLQQEQL